MNDQELCNYSKATWLDALNQFASTSLSLSLTRHAVLVRAECGWGGADGGAGWDPGGPRLLTVTAAARL